MFDQVQIFTRRTGARPLARLTRQLDALRRSMAAGSRPPSYATPAERARRLQQELERLRVGAGLTPVIRGMLPLGASLLVANHVSDLDPVVLGSLLPCAVVIERDRVSGPLLRGLTAPLGVIVVDRGCPHSGARALRQIARTLHQGVSVVVFPEPSATRGERVLPMRPGVFELARRLGIPVVPVRLDHESHGSWDDAAPEPRGPRSRVRVWALEPLWPRRHHPAVALAELVGKRLAMAAPRWQSAGALSP